MKKLFTLLAVVLLALSVNAQETLTLSGGWGWSNPTDLPGKAVFPGQWNFMNIGNGAVDCSVYTGVKITYSDLVLAEGTVINIKAKAGDMTDENALYVALDPAASEVTATFGDAFAGLTINKGDLNLQSSGAGNSVYVKSVALIKADNSTEEIGLSSGWDATIESTLFLFNSQWAELGNWTADFTEGSEHVYTLNLNAPAPADFQFKVYKSAGEDYPPVTEGATTVDVVIKEAYTKVTLQYKGTETPGKLDIASITRTIRDASGINSVSSQKIQPTAIYNLAGQKVNAQYKGVVIKNGKKIMQ